MDSPLETSSPHSMMLKNANLNCCKTKENKPKNIIVPENKVIAHLYLE